MAGISINDIRKNLSLLNDQMEEECRSSEARFRDHVMIKQIAEKVVNRLRQVTAAILQDGTNQVNIITSTAERQAAIEFAKANAIHPQIVGAALKQICADPEVAQALLEILQIDRMAKDKGKVTVMPPRSELLATCGCQAGRVMCRRRVGVWGIGGGECAISYQVV
jgi:hypothetical protein